MKLTELDYILLLAIDAEAEDITDYVKLTAIVSHFPYLRDMKTALNSCVEKRLIVLSNFSDLIPGKGSEIALTEAGIRECIARKKALNLP